MTLMSRGAAAAIRSRGSMRAKRSGSAITATMSRFATEPKGLPYTAQAVRRHQVITQRDHHEDIPLGNKSTGKTLIHIQQSAPVVERRSLAAYESLAGRRAMTTTVERLRTTLAALSLTAIDARLETLLENASKKEPSYGDFLLEVMSAEADARKQRYLKTRLQLAHLPYREDIRSVRFRHFSLRSTSGRSASCARCDSCMRRPT